MKLCSKVFPLSSITQVSPSLSPTPLLDVGKEASCWASLAIVQWRLIERRCRRDRSKKFAQTHIEHTWNTVEMGSVKVTDSECCGLALFPEAYQVFLSIPEPRRLRQIDPKSTD